MDCCTLARMAGLAPYALRSTLETAVVDTLACRATSTIVTRRGACLCTGSPLRFGRCGERCAGRTSVLIIQGPRDGAEVRTVQKLLGAPVAAFPVGMQPPSQMK